MADLLLEPGPGAARASIAMAIVTWLAAAICIALIWVGGGMKRIPAHPQRIPVVLKGAAEVFIGIFLVVLAGQLLSLTIPQPPAPQGWTIVRPPQEISSLALLGNTVWAGGRGGLYAIDRLTGQLRRIPSGTHRLRYVKDLLTDTAGALWVAHEDGVTRVLEAGSQTFPFPTPVLALTQLRDGSLWAGTVNGLSSFADGKWQRIEGPGASFLFEDSQRRIWAALDDPEKGGVSRLENGRWISIEGLQGICVNSVAQDSAGSIWMATGFSSSGALVRWNETGLQRWSRKEGLPGGRVRSVYVDHKGRLWIGSEYDGLTIAEAAGDVRRLHLLTPNNGVAGWEVKEMVEDPDGVYWLGTENGVSRIAGGI